MQGPDQLFLWDVLQAIRQSCGGSYDFLQNIHWLSGRTNGDELLR